MPRRAARIPGFRRGREMATIRQPPRAAGGRGGAVPGERGRGRGRARHRPARGLSDAEARARLREHGRNELAARPPVPAWRRFLAQFQDVLVILLLVATAISAGLWVYERDTALPYEALAILAVVLLNATMGYVQESRAEAAVAALRAMSAAEATVHARRRAAARARPRSSSRATSSSSRRATRSRPTRASSSRRALQTAEAALTGESLPVSKDTAPVDDEAALGDRHNMVFSGTAATYGRGTGRRDRDGDAHRDGTHRRPAGGDARRRRRRCSGSSTARASCSAASSSPSPS